MIFNEKALYKGDLKVGDSVKVVSKYRTENNMQGKIVVVNPPDLSVNGEMRTYFPIVVRIADYSLPNKQKPKDDGYLGDPCFKPEHLELIPYDIDSIVGIGRTKKVKCISSKTSKHVTECLACEHLDMIISPTTLSCKFRWDEYLQKVA